MVIGRGAELARIDRLLASARLGTSEALVITGEAGIGKTALLEYAVAQASGMTVLRAAGVESESEIPFAGLLTLLRPVLGRIDELPPPQADALRAALGLAAGAGGDRFLIGAATLTLLTACAEHSPVLVVIDDAQWIDESSLAAILFAARRLLADALAIVVASRAGPFGLPELSLPGLDRATAAALLERHAGRPLPPGAADRAFEATLGNPLALVELAGSAAALPLEGAVPVRTTVEAASPPASARCPDPPSASWPWPPPTRGEPRRDRGRRPRRRHLAPTLARSPRRRRGSSRSRSTGSCSVIPSRGRRRIGARRRTSGGPRTRRSPRSSRMPIGGRGTGRRRRSGPTRRWPTSSKARGCGRVSAGRTRRRRARSSVRRGSRRTRPPGRGGSSRRPRPRGSPGTPSARTSASPTPARCARTPSCASRSTTCAGTRRCAAGTCGRRTTSSSKQRATPRPSRPSRCSPRRPTRAGFAADPARMLDAARRAQANLTPATSPRARVRATLALGMALIYSGEDGAPPLREATAILDAEPDLATDPTLLASAAIGALWLREAQRGRVLIQRAIDTARQQGAVGALPFPLWLAGRDAATSDRPHVAVALYEEAIRLARETGQATSLCAGLAGLACVEARQGRETPHAPRRSSSRKQLGLAFFELWALDALAELELGRGNLDPAIQHLRAKQQLLAERGIADPDVSPVPDLASIDPDTPLEAFEHAAVAKGQPWSLARLARAQGDFERAAGPARPHARPLRDRPHPARPGRSAAPRTPARPGARTAPRSHRHVRRARRRPLGRARPPRAAGQRRDRSPPRPAHARRAHPARAPGRARRRRGPHDPRDRRKAVPLPQDRRPPPAERLPQARDRLPRRPHRRHFRTPSRCERPTRAT